VGLSALRKSVNKAARDTSSSNSEKSRCISTCGAVVRSQPSHKSDNLRCRAESEREESSTNLIAYNRLLFPIRFSPRSTILRANGILIDSKLRKFLMIKLE